MAFLARKKWEARRSQRKSVGKTWDVFKEHFFDFLHVYITIVYISLQEWQNIHKTMFTTIY